jgi:hypothetical protein
MDPSKRMDKGKSSHVSSVGNPVTSHETVDRSASITKTPHVTIRDQQVLLETNKALLAFGKQDRRKAPSGWSMTEA